MKESTKAKIGIFSLTLLAMSALGITPSIGLIMAEYPDAGAGMVQQLTGIPNLVAILGAVLFSVLANKVPRKAIAVAAPALIAAGGLLPAFVDGGLPFLLACSGVLGLGVGMVTNTANLLITDLVPAEEREATMAQNVVFVNVGSIVMTVGGGMLSAGGWQNNYLIYLVALPILVLILLCVPSYRPETGSEGPAAAPGAPKASLGAVAIVCGLTILSYNFAYSAFPNNAALILAANKIGDSSMAGLVIAAGTLGGIVFGLVLGKVVKYFQRFSLAVGLGLMGISFIALAYATSLPVVVAASFLIGGALSIGFAQCPFIISIGTAPMLIPAAMGVFSALSSVGGFLSPIAINAAAPVAGGGPGASCLVAGVFAVAVCVILVVSGFQGRVLDRAFGGKEH